MKPEDIRNVTVVGAGLMGHGIAQEFALAGYRVSLYDLTDEKLRKAMTSIEDNLRLMTDLGLVERTQWNSVLRNIHPHTALEKSVADADVVIEAVFEELDLKQDVFRRLDAACPVRTILASNSSTLLPSQLATATNRPDRVLVAHYLNPPYLIPLVELVRHPGTSDATIAAMRDLLKKVGKQPAVLRKETPGFIANRLQAAVLREALSLVEHGIATAADVDLVVKSSFGRRYAVAGPFEVWELAGWDLILSIMQYLTPTLESSREISPVLREMVADGRLGTKVGKGFYEWTPASIEASKARIGRALAMLGRES